METMKIQTPAKPLMPSLTCQVAIENIFYLTLNLKLHKLKYKILQLNLTFHCKLGYIIQYFLRDLLYN